MRKTRKSTRKPRDTKIVESELEIARKQMSPIFEDLRDRFNEFSYSDKYIVPLRKEKGKIESNKENYEIGLFGFTRNKLKPNPKARVHDINDKLASHEKYITEQKNASEVRRKTRAASRVGRDRSANIQTSSMFELQRELKKAKRRDAKHEKSARVAAVLGQARGGSAAVRKRLPRNHSCPYCGEGLGLDPHADHIHPVSKGGQSTPCNMVYACSSCNSKKTNLTLRAFCLKYELDRKDVEDRLIVLGKDI